MRDQFALSSVLTAMTEPAAPNPAGEPRNDELVEGLVRDFSASLYRQARSIVRDHALAEDVVQDTLVQAWLAFGTYRGEGSIRAWIMRIGHNTAVSALRRLREEVVEPLRPDLRDGLARGGGFVDPGN